MQNKFKAGNKEKEIQLKVKAKVNKMLRGKLIWLILNKKQVGIDILIKLEDRIEKQYTDKDLMKETYILMVTIIKENDIVCFS